jgi:hypothetical protein
VGVPLPLPQHCRCACVRRCARVCATQVWCEYTGESARTKKTPLSSVFTLQDGVLRGEAVSIASNCNTLPVSCITCIALHYVADLHLACFTRMGQSLEWTPASDPSNYEAHLSLYTPGHRGSKEPMLCVVVKFDVGLGGPITLPRDL